MEQKNEPIQAIDMKKIILKRAFSHILDRLEDSREKDDCIDDLIAYFLECERRKEKEVLEDMHMNLEEVGMMLAEGKSQLTPMAIIAMMKAAINSRLASIEAKK